MHANFAQSPAEAETRAAAAYSRDPFGTSIAPSLLSAADDGSVRVFAADTGKLIASTDVVAQARDYVASAVALPRSRRFVVGTARGVVLVVELPGK